MRPDDPGAVRMARRLCAARIARAARALAARPDDAAVHDARRELKRARALLRLLRGGLPDEAHAAINVLLRDVGRMLGAARDAAVVGKLARDAGASIGVSAALLAPLLRRFDRERRARRAAIDVPRAHGELLRARRALLAARVEGDAAVLAGGFVRIYRRGRRALAAAHDVPRPARLHEWRKHVKQYWHALEVLEPAWPRLIEAVAHEAHRLSDVLGDHHDCTMLAARLDDAPLPPQLRRRLASALTRRRAVLRVRAFAIGARLYEQRPRRLAPRAAEWWRHWVDVAPVELRRAARATRARGEALSSPARATGGRRSRAARAAGSAGTRERARVRARAG